MHDPLKPAPRHARRYADAEVVHPEATAPTERNHASRSRWIRERRYGIHGIGRMQTGRFDDDPVPDSDALFRSYCETVRGLDENVGRVLE